MINQLDLRNRITSEFPNWNINVRASGVSWWANINDGNLNYFEIQVTPNEGIGLSIVDTETTDMSGHEEVFSDLDETFKFIKMILTSK